MELRQLRYALAVDEAGSFTAAAQQCHVTQSALSAQVAALESELGVRLFDRTTRRVAVTEAGQVFLPEARRLVAGAAELRANMHDLTDGQLGVLRIGATQAASRILDLPALLGSFHRDHPRVGLTMAAGPADELLDLLARGEIDMALAASSPTAALHFQPLAPPHPLVAVIPTDFTVPQRDRLDLRVLAEVGPFVEFRSGTALRTMLDEAFGRIGIHRNIILELGQIEDMVRCAAHGLGIAVVPVAFTTHIPAHQATVHRIDEPSLSLIVGAYTRAHHRSSPVSAALALFRGLAATPTGNPGSAPGDARCASQSTARSKARLPHCAVDAEPRTAPDRREPA